MLAIIVGQFNLPITIDKNVFRYFCKDATFQMLWLIHQIAKPQNQAHALGKIVLEVFGIAILMVIYTM